MTTETKTPEIRTNRQPRELISWSDLTDKERAEFDYIEYPEQYTGMEFFRYKGRAYYLGDFMHLDKKSTLFGEYWHGYSSSTAFSGTLVHLDDTDESVIVGQYFS